MADNFFRLLRLLQLVPRAPKSTDTARIAAALESEGITTSMRTIQRDLVHLESMGFALECVEGSKPYRWRFSATADAVLVPGLDPQAALALRIVELHLERMLPKSTVAALQAHLQAARKALEHKPVARWLEKVKLIPRSQPLVPPKVDGAVTGVVHEALLEGKQIDARYRPRGAPTAKPMTLHPLGLVHRECVAYLVATAFSYTDPRIYPLHRFTSAELLDQKSRTPAGFDLEAYIAKGELGFRVGDENIDVELLFTKDAGQNLEESPLAPDQVLVRNADESVLVKAKVANTMVLRSWILGYGANVEVIRPKTLRAAIADTHRTAAKRYASQ